MIFKEGMIVKSLSGHDAGRHYVVIRMDETAVYLADGKRKRLTNLKSKNIKHVAPADGEVVDVSCQTDKTIRKLVNRFNNMQSN